MWHRCSFWKAHRFSENFYRSQVTINRNFWTKKSLDESCKEKEEITPFDEFEKLPDAWSQPKVVVIGAGIAGLSAAHTLVQNGIYDVTVLEAIDRSGGRIHSCWFSRSVAELGASVIKGACLANSAYNLAVKQYLIESPVLRQGSLKRTFYTSQGNSINTSVALKASTAFSNIERIAMTQLYKDDTNLETFMSTHISQELKNFPDFEKEAALMVMNTYLTTLKEKIGANLDCVKTKNYDSLSSLPGGDVKIPIGFVGILAPLIRDIPECVIKYSKPVDCVHWNVVEADKPRACVLCADGESFSADYVVITTPLGFLKDKAQNFFIPNLPAKKMDAIKSLGFGHMNRFFLQFSEPICLKDEGEIMFAWHPDDYGRCGSWVKGLASLVVDESSEQILSGVVAGKEAITMEMLEEDKILSDIQNHMHCFLDNPSIPKPSKMLRSTWSTNVFTQGAFTYITTESGLGQIKDLAEPTPDTSQNETPVLFFAGEHTCPNNYATVHGARDSGIREANRIVKYTKDLKGAPSKQQNQ